MLFVFACGSGSDDPLERPSGSPPEEEVPTPPESLLYGEEEGGIPVKIPTRALYNTENVEVFYTDPLEIDDSLNILELLFQCSANGALEGHSFKKIGILNGMFKEQGYTKDFLLNPDVERTWSGLDGSSSDVIANTVDNEFLSPLLSNTSSCVGNDEVTCKRFMCGVKTGD